MSDPNTSYDTEALHAEAIKQDTTSDMTEKDISFVLDRHDSGPPMTIEYEKAMHPPIVYARKQYNGGRSFGYNADEVFGK
jgi:hypothetical protein